MKELFSKISNLFGAPDIAVDLGTANTRMFAAGRGLIADVPTILETNRRAKNRARASLNGSRSPHCEPVMPLEGGVVKNVPAAARFLKKLLRRTRRFHVSAPRLIVCAPSDISNEERAALIESATRAGAADVAIVPEPLAAAIGAGLDVSSPYAQMLVDIGDGVTDIAVIREGDLIQTNAVRTAGGALHEAIQAFMARRYGIRLRRREAEFLIKKLGAAGDSDAASRSIKISGLNDKGEKVLVGVQSEEIRAAIDPVIGLIAETVSQTVREMPPPICAEVVETGICLTGGVADLPGIAEYISAATDLEVAPAPAPLYSVINGASRMLETAAATNLWHRRADLS